MTNESLIKKLVGYRSDPVLASSSLAQLALNMAIRAVEDHQSPEISVGDSDLREKLRKHCYDRYDTEYDASVLPSNAFDEEVDNLIAVISPHLRTTKPVSGEPIPLNTVARLVKEIYDKDLGEIGAVIKLRDAHEIAKAVLDAAGVKYAE